MFPTQNVAVRRKITRPKIHRQYTSAVAPRAGVEVLRREYLATNPYYIAVIASGTPGHPIAVALSDTP